MARRVLVIDDDPNARTIVKVMLETEGFEVVGAEDGSRGLILARTGSPDLVLLDVQMPGMDGYEVCRHLRKDPQTNRVPVVMLTASDDPALNRRAYEAGAHACIPKPVRKEGLIALIEAALPRPSREGAGEQA